MTDKELVDALALRTRRFGFDWEIFANDMGDWGELEFVTPSIDGDYYVIVSETGEIGLFEFGGRGPGVWDRELGSFDSILAAMFHARKVEKDLLIDIEKYNKETDDAHAQE